MNSTADAEDRPRERQVSTPSDNPSSAWNALKHGLRSAAVLLPDDDGQEFQHLRRDLFETYRPRTGDEAACVEAMAAHHSRVARCRRWQAVYDAQTDALLTGDPNRLAGHICETDSHVWIHKSMDCVLPESRLDRLLCRSRDKLLLLQKLRRNHLIAGAMEPAPIFWPDESLPSGGVSSPLGEARAQFGDPQCESGGPGPRSRDFQTVGADRDPPQHEVGTYANAPVGEGVGKNGPSPSADGEIKKYDERTATPASPSIPKGFGGVTSPSLARGTGRVSGQEESRAAEGAAWAWPHRGDAGLSSIPPASVQLGETEPPPRGLP